MNLVLVFSICFFVNVYWVAYRNHTSRIADFEEELLGEGPAGPGELGGPR